MKLSDNEIKVLDALTNEDAYCFDERAYLNFDAIGKIAGLERRIVRLACRSLKRRGLTEYGTGLWNDDGTLAGSGYRVTWEGEREVSNRSSDKQETTNEP